ncbi:hypothetical protein [Actinoplanes sp. TFC3]|uniref:hypothetical protein n=1 Tax=Actinoplanes sp. TFC3 TaxID=1710355 RepID=UPI00082AE65D|nr:hypothetical protein [Actinoplanes sp. TFC3]
MAPDCEDPSSPFAGELFLTLAAEGRLVVDSARADAVISGLERTLSLARARLRVLRIWQHAPAQRVDELPRELADDVVDAVFADQLAPGRLEEAVTELPKYIEAMRQARRLVPPGDAA